MTPSIPPGAYVLNEWVISQQKNNEEHELKMKCRFTEMQTFEKKIFLRKNKW